MTTHASPSIGQDALQQFDLDQRRLDEQVRRLRPGVAQRTDAMLKFADRRLHQRVGDLRPGYGDGSKQGLDQFLDGHSARHSLQGEIPVIVHPVPSRNAEPITTRAFAHLLAYPAGHVLAACIGASAAALVCALGY